MKIEKTLERDGFEAFVEKRPVRPQDWNELVSSFTEGSFFQSTHWGDYLNQCHGYDTYYVSLKRDKSIYGMALIWVKKAKFANIPFYSRAFCFYGPLLKDYTKENVEIFFKALDKICIDNKITLLDKLCLPMHFETMSDYTEMDKRVFLEGHGYFSRNWATILVDLKKQESELWENIHYSAKKCLKKNEHEGIEVSMVSEAQEYEEFCNLLNDFLHKNRLVFPYYILPMWDFLKNKEKRMEVFVAKQKGRMHGGLCVFPFNNIIFEMAAWRSDYAVHNNLYIGDAIKWEVIRWAKRKGFKQYDLSGVSPEPSTDKEKGIRRFKEKWGGQVVVYRDFSKVYKKSAHYVYEMMKRIYNYSGRG